MLHKKIERYPTLGQLMKDDSEWCERCPFIEDDCIIAKPANYTSRKKVKCTRYKKEKKWNRGEISNYLHFINFRNPQKRVDVFVPMWYIIGRVRKNDKGEENEDLDSHG